MFNNKKIKSLETELRKYMDKYLSESFINAQLRKSICLSNAKEKELTEELFLLKEKYLKMLNKNIELTERITLFLSEKDVNADE